MRDDACDQKAKAGKGAGRLRRRIGVVVATAMVLSVGLPTGAVPADGGFPLSGLWTWLRTSAAWATSSAYPIGPAQLQGGAKARGHYVTSGRGDADQALVANGLLPNGSPKTRQESSTTPTRAQGVFDPATSRRDPKKSTGSSTFFVNADGSVTKQLSSGRVNYQQTKGSWQPIDTTLTARGGRLQSAANDVVASFAGPARTSRTGVLNGLAGIEAAAAQGAWSELATLTLPGGQEIGFGLDGATAVLPEVSGSTATYREILPETDIELVATPEGLKESIILTSAQAATSWVFPLRLDGITLHMTEDGAIELRSTDGVAVAQIPRGTMWDSGVVDVSGAPPTSNGVTYELASVDGVPTLTVSVDQSWINDPARVFPIYVDPTTLTYTTGDVYVDSDTLTTNQNGDNLPIGTYDGGGVVARSFMHFDNFDDDGLVGKRMTSANLKLYHTWSYDCLHHEQFYVHRVRESWTVAGLTSAALPGPATSSYIGRMTVGDNYPACTNTGGDRSIGAWVTVSMSVGTFDGWSSGETNYGLALTTSETDNYAWKRFTSANYSSGSLRPRLEFTYTDNVAPQVNWTSPTNGGAVSTLTPQLQAGGLDSDAFPKTLKYRYLVYEQVDEETQTQVADSGWVTTGAWTVPTNTLAWGRTYRWSAQVYDGMAYSPAPTESARQVFSTPPPQPAVTSALSTNGDRGFALGANNYTTVASDAQVSTVGPALAVQRYYNSADPRIASAFGASWSSLADARAKIRRDAGGSVLTVVVTYPDGRDVAFARESDGTFTPPASRFVSFAATTGGYELVEKDHTRYLFTTAAGTDVYGLTSVTDAAGRALTLTWTSGHPTTLTGASGRSLDLAWATPAGAAYPHVATVTNDLGYEWDYSYSGDRLISVCPPTSPTACTQYTYTNGSRYASVVNDLDPYSYWRLGEAAGSKAASQVEARMGVDAGAFSNVSYAQSGPLSGTTATAVGFNGTTSRVSLPVNAVTQSGNQSISLWFKQTAGNGVLYSQSYDPITSTSTNGAYTPILYTGTDGKLYGQFPTATEATSQYAITHNLSGRCLNAPSATNNELPIIYDCDGSAGQTFTMDSSQRLSVTISGVTKCLDLLGGETGDGTDVILYTCGTDDAQKWTLHPDGRLVNKKANRCIATYGAGSTNSLKLYIWTCAKNGSPSQRWFPAAHSPMVSSTTVNDGQWHHVVLSAAGSTQKMYLDGAEVASKSGEVASIGARYAYLGAGFLGGRWPKPALTSSSTNAGSPSFFTGAIAEVTQFDRALTGGEAASAYAARAAVGLLHTVARPSGRVDATIDYDAVRGEVSQVTDANGATWTLNPATVSGSSLIHAAAVLGGVPADYWRMKETGVVEAVNEVNGSTAAYSDVTLGATGSGPFTDATGASFNGTTSYLAADGPSVDTAQSYSISAWVKLTSSASNQRAVAIAGSQVPGAWLGYDTSANRWQMTMYQSDVDNATGSGVSSTAAPTLNSWTHLVGTYDGGTRELTLYVNGVNQGSVTVGGTAWSAGGPLTIGRGQWNGAAADYWSGPLAEVATYRTVLSAADVVNQYTARNQTTGTVPAKHVSITGPRGETTSQVYDVENGRLVAETDGLGNETQYGYSLAGFMRAVVDPQGNITINDHDVRGNLLSATSCQDYSTENCSTAFYTYYPDATTRTLTPDARNDLILTERESGSTSASDNTYLTTYTYATDGTRTSMTDPLGRVTTITYTDGSSIAAADTGYAPAGLPSTSATLGNTLATIVYYHNGDIASVTDAAGMVTTYTYDALGRVLTETEVNSSYPSGLTTTYTYDELDRVETETTPAVTNRVTGAIHTARTTTTYNDDGQVLTETVSDLTGGDASRAVSYGYNTLGQVITETDAESNTTQYEYDEYGDVDRVSYPDGTTVRTEYDVTGNELANILENWTGDDPDNPLTAVDLTLNSMTYDASGRLRVATDAMGWETQYDYTDNGLLKTVTRHDPSTSASYVHESNTYYSTGELQTRVTNNGLTTTSYTYDNDGRALTATLDPSGLNRTTTFAYSHLDDVVSTTMTQGSQVLARSKIMYDPLGRVVAQSTYTGSGLTPVGRWKLNETTGTTAADSAGNSPALATGSLTWSTDHGGSAALTGGTGSSLATVGPVVDTTQSFTVSAWVKLTSTGSNKTAVSQDGRVRSSFNLGFDNSSNRWRFQTCRGNGEPNGCTPATSSSVPSLSTWTHLAGVYDQPSGKLRLYVNGTFETEVSTEARIPSTGPLRIGAAQWASAVVDKWPGSISDVQVYGQALTGTEVSSVYGGTAPAADATVLRTTNIRDTSGEITAVIDPSGNQTTLVVDELGRTAGSASPQVSTVVGTGSPVAASALSWIGYNNFGEAVETKNPNGNTTTYRYDANGQVTSIEQPSYTPPGSSTPLAPEITYTYDAAGQLVLATDPLANETAYDYDQLGRLAKVTAADGGITRYTYALTGEQLSTTDPTGARATATYDYLGRTLTSTKVVRQTSSSHTTTFNYASATWPSSVVSPGGVSTSFTYNAAGETLTATDGASNTTSYQYDGLGRRTRVTLPDNTYSTVDYDQAGRVLSSKSYSAANALLRTVSNSYDARGNVVATIDGRGTTKTFSYDATGRLVGQVEPISVSDSITTSFGYDVAGNQTRVVDGRGNAFITTYNVWGLPESQIEPSTSAYSALADRTFTFGYDLAGRLATAQSPGGVSVDYDYDALGRLVSQAGTGAEASTVTREFGYDLAGRITSLSGSGGGNTLTYEDRGLLLTTSGPSGASQFTYTADGAMASRQDAAGTTNYTYDSAGRLDTVGNSGAGLSLDYDYNSLSQVSQINYGSSANKRQFTYDSLHRATLDKLVNSGGTTLASIAYAWDANNNLTNKTTTGFTGSASNDYTYDLADRLTSWDNGVTPVVYAYDKSGNRVQSGSKTFTYDARNQLVSDSGGTTYEYTARGTLRHATTGGVTLDTSADAFNQVASQELVGGGSTDYTYDGLGRVVRSGFAYSGLGNTLAADGGATYVRGADDGLLGVSSGASYRFAWTDPHRDVVGEFTASGGALSGSTTFEPFGTVVATSGMTGSLGFQSEWTDGLSGRVNMLSRWYNPDTGQFDTRDAANVSAAPVSVRGNRFAYGDDNPLTNTDPTGEATTSTNEGGCRDLADCELVGAQSEVEYYERQMEQARKDSRVSLKSMLLSIGLSFLLDMIGFNDLMGCLRGSLFDCVSLASNFLGPIKFFKVAHTIFKGLDRAFSAYKTWKRIVEVGKKLIGTATKLLDKARSTLAALKKKLPGKPKAPKKAPRGKGPGKPKANHPKPPKTKAPSKQARPAKANTGPKKAERPANSSPKNSTPKKSKSPESKSDRREDSAGQNSRDTEGPGGKSEPDSGGAKRQDTTAGSEQHSAPEPEPASCPTHSFAPTTRVLMADGTTKAIRDITIGDQVKATDPDTGHTTAQPVTRLHVNRDHDLTNVTLRVTTPPTTPPQNPDHTPNPDHKPGRLARVLITAATAIIATAGATPPTATTASTTSPTQGTTTVLHTTAHHPFWDHTTNTWVDAADLQPGHQLHTDNTNTATIVNVATHTGDTTMHDLTINQTHTYYVVAGTTPVLVHNCGTGNAPRTPDGKFATRNGEPGRDGAGDEMNALDHLEMDGANVMRNETPVSVPGMPVRKYDGTVEIDGQWYGVETKGGTAKRSPAQKAFDDWLNTPGNTVTTKDGRTLVGVFDVWIDR